MSYWVDFIHPSSRYQTWSNALKDEDDVEKVWASVKQLRCWYFAHRVSVLRYDPEASPGSCGKLVAGEWDRHGNLLTWADVYDRDYPAWMLRPVSDKDRIPPPARKVPDPDPGCDVVIK